ncbi:MAG: carbohydrate porin [Myxococcales bacterium]|nr:carbohydrate porin [Myxococcales bacterium]MCB9546960.1 carbohydrate porin [Myxococcales bacterium]
MRLLSLSLLALVGTARAADPPPAADRFEFGSYGRMGVAMDGEGGRGERRQIVAFGPRLIEDNYLELDFGYRVFEGPEGRARVRTTVAFFDDLFHYTGQVDATLALRQAYVEGEDLFRTGAYAWIGSRWQRGDDIYLFDLWPMDDLNLVGVGGGYRDARLHLGVALGLNRLEDGRQVDRVPVPAPSTFGAQTVTLHDRQRVVAAAQATWQEAAGYKLKLYSELHFLPRGRRTLAGSFTETEALPDDLGFVIGAQVGLWNFARNGHLNVWLRYAGGLAAYDELGTPAGLNDDRRSVDAQEYRAALAGNVELALGDDAAFGVQYGAWARYFLDADDEEEDFDDRFEAAIAARPQLMLGLFTPAVEGSVQISRPNGLNPQTNRQAVARVVQLALVPALTLARDPGVYDRPQLRLIYAVSLLNQAALDLYAQDDPRSDHDVVHYLGARAEWWFGRGGGY